jgi:hypothetical protein
MTVAVCALALGITTMVFGQVFPGPPEFVVCGCACPDGSFVTVCVDDESQCEVACAWACPQDM